MKIFRIVVLLVCLSGLTACSSKPKNPLSVLPASALSLIQLDAQKNPNMSSQDEQIKEDSPLAMAMKRINAVDDASEQEDGIKVLSVNTDQDSAAKLYADIQSLKVEGWNIEKITAGAIENVENSSDSNVAINAVLNVYSFSRDVLSDNQSVSIKYDETLPVKTISFTMIKPVSNKYGDLPNA